MSLVVVYLVALVVGIPIGRWLNIGYDFFSPATHIIVSLVFLLLATPVIAKRMRDAGLSPYLMIPALLLVFFLPIPWLFLVVIIGVLPKKALPSVFLSDPDRPLPRAEEVF